MSVTGGIMAGVGLAGSIGGAAISANAATNAADTQASAAEQAQQLQSTEAQNALDFQKQEWGTQQENLAPWLTAGKGALTTLEGLTNKPGEGLLTPWTSTFQAPTAAEAAQYPGYQFQQEQGQETLQNSAASKGNLLSGNTLEALTRYGQDFAQSDYTNVYDQALQQYQQSYNIFQNNQANEFNRLAAESGTGQTAATTLGTEGTAAANTVGNIDLTTGAQQGQDIQNAGAATASGYVGAANAWNSGISNGTSNLMNYALMQQLFNQPGGSSGADMTPWNSPSSANTNAIY